MSANLPTVAIVGRPNVGKSTLFNRLTRKWQAIVEDRPGITRDRLYGDCKIGDYRFRLMDTGGLQFENPTAVEKKMSAQAFQAIEDADMILFVMDGRAGVTSMDREWIQKIRKTKKPKIFLVNKLDEPSLDVQAQEFHELGVQPLVPISFEKQRNFSGLYEEIKKALPKCRDAGHASEKLTSMEPNLRTSAGRPYDQDSENLAELSIAICGRPNVGKSTLLNAILDEERCIVDDVPGTTRDPIHSHVSVGGKNYRFIDTAGIRRRAKTKQRVEKFSVVQSLHVIDEADIVLLLIDSTTGPTEQDAHVAGYAFEKGKAIVLVANKWDEGQHLYTREAFEERLELKMNYLQHCPVIYISAKTGKNLKKIFEAVEFIKEQYDKEIRTGELNRAFEYIVEHHPMPVYKGQSIKMYYATQVSCRPPSFVVFCNYPKQVHFTYKRYVTNALREMFKLQNVPVRVIFKGR